MENQYKLLNGLANNIPIIIFLHSLSLKFRKE